jgi:predicted DNA-binding transcriptional regulator AlpA
MQQIDHYLSKVAVARIFGCSTRSLDNWVKRGQLPKPERLPNGRPAWRESVIRGSVASPDRVAATG